MQQAMKLEPINPQVQAVIDVAGLHVGNLKLIQGQWKFKAVGYLPDGSVIPGGGPLTQRHNQVFDQLDEGLISVRLGLV